ncbi:MAG: EAL domain-containing protein [Sulfuricaulis sp.]|nr:EAL domain-containing protein [Sulfuricaulis sp.]
MDETHKQSQVLHEATLRLLSLLATARLEEDLLQSGLETLAAILQARYGAIRLTDEAGKLQQFVYTGITPEEAARIGHPPEGRGLLGVTTPLRLDDMHQDLRSAGFPPNHPPMKSLLSVNFSHQGRIYGRVYLSEKNDGSAFTQEDQHLLTRFADAFAQMLGYHRSQIERERSTKTLSEVSQTLSAITGDSFFRELVLNLGKALGVAFAFVGEVTDTSCHAIRTVAVNAGEKSIDNFVYELSGTPCENIVGKKICFYTQGVQRLFPNDRMLVEMGIESYIGSPLFNSAGKPLGILALLDTKPLTDPEHAEAILKICAGRAAAELEHRHQELALRESEERFRQMAENAKEVFWMTDPAIDKMIYISPAYEEIWGRRCQDLYNNSRNWVEGIHPEDRERVLQAALKHHASGEYHQEYRIVRPDGSLRWILDRGFPIRDKSGKVYRVTGIAEDITERKQAEEEILMKARLLDNTSESIFVLDLAGKIIYANETAWKSRGYTRDELMKLDLRTIDTPECAKLIPSRMREILERGQLTFESAHCRKDGSVMPIEVSARVFEIDGKKVFLSAMRDITERKKTEDLLSRLGRTLDDSHNEIYVFDAATLRFVQANKGARLNLGFSMAELREKTPVDLKPEFNHESFNDLIDPLRRGAQETLAFVTSHQRKDGSLYPVEVRLHLSRNEHPPVFVAIIQDIAERKKAEDTLRASEASLAYAQHMAHIGNWERNIVTNEVRWSKEVYRIFGLNPQQSSPTFAAFLNAVHPDDRQNVIDTVNQAVSEKQPYRSDFRVVQPDGTERIVHSEAEITFDKNGAAVYLFGTIQDVTEHRQVQERLRYLAYYDSLTGLPNRQQVNDSLYRAMLEAESRERLVAVMFLDLDRFKNINDTLGHDVGDALLKEVAVRLKASLRPGDSISRLGGDEFILILGNIAHINDVTRVAQKILDQFIPPFRIGGRDLFISPSVGITLYPFDDNNPENLLRNADIAMYRAKELGRNNFQFYTPELNVRAARRLELETGLRRALEKEEFILHYQPLVNMQSGKITGMEALLRWQHPEFGLIAPMDFIPLAEETGLIVPVGEWVLRTACAQIKTWHGTGFPAMHVAVNLSSVQLQQKNFAETVKRALRETGLEPQYLDLELTESLLMHDMEAVEKILKELKALGVLFSLDDFGTGYSSLSYLKRFPIDFLKIDRSFVNDINQDRYGAGIVRAIIVMAHTLGIKVIAEGVETNEQLEFLREQGCDITQGYFCSEPLATVTFTELLMDWQRIRMGKCGINKPVLRSRKKQAKSPRRP